MGCDLPDSSIRVSISKSCVLFLCGTVSQAPMLKKVSDLFCSVHIESLVDEESTRLPINRAPGCLQRQLMVDDSKPFPRASPFTIAGKTVLKHEGCQIQSNQLSRYERSFAACRGEMLPARDARYAKGEEQTRMDAASS